MIRSAPRRRAASTAHRPTAPSPTTATVSPGLTRAQTAAWWPVPITSDSVSSDACISGGVPGAGYRDEGAVGQWYAHGLPLAAVAVGRERSRRSSQAVVMPCRQWGQVPSLKANGAITKSPRWISRTSAPTSSTTPMNSWPIGPGANGGLPAVVPEVRAAHAREHDAHDGVGRLGDRGIGALAYRDGSGLVEDGCTHGGAPWSAKRSVTSPSNLLRATSARTWTESQLAAARDDPQARLALITRTYRGPADRLTRHLPFRRAALSFMHWQVERGVLESARRRPAGERLVASRERTAAGGWVRIGRALGGTWPGSRHRTRSGCGSSSSGGRAGATGTERTTRASSARTWTTRRWRRPRARPSGSS